jgi:hypothetical protein
MTTSRFSISFWALNLGVLALVLLGTGCSNAGEVLNATPLPNAPAPSLLLDEKPFPPKWQVAPGETSRDLRDTHAIRGFGRRSIAGQVIQNVYQFDSVRDALAKYQLYRKADFAKAPPPQVPSTELVTPSEITYQSPIADEYYLGCGWNVAYICRALFRYRNYVVEFYFDIDSGNGEGMKVREVEPIVRAMDEQTSSVLGIPFPTPTPTP